jgi:hypothetical protein
MKRGQVFVRAKDVNGYWYSADALDLDQPSFNAFVLEMLKRAGAVITLKDEFAGGNIEYQSTVRKPEDE